MHDEANTSSPSTRHRLDTGSAARTPAAGGYAGANSGGQNAPVVLRDRADSGDSGDGKTVRVEGMSFSEALQHLRSGAKVARTGWNGKGQYIEVQYPDPRSKMTRPYIFIHTVDGDLVPWIASQSDLLSFDWCLVREVTALVFGNGGRPETHREESAR